MISVNCLLSVQVISPTKDLQQTKQSLLVWVKKSENGSFKAVMWAAKQLTLTLDGLHKDGLIMPTLDMNTVYVNDTMVRESNVLFILRLHYY